MRPARAEQARRTGPTIPAREEHVMSDGVIALVVLLVLVLAVAALLLARRRRGARPRERLGPEHDRTVEGRNQTSAAPAPRRERIQLVPLDPAARARYLETWHRTQARFVDAPREATRRADRLVTEVMRVRGYPVEDFEQRAAGSPRRVSIADLSVDHPRLVRDYRAARAVASANDRSEAGTEDLRQALVHYRSLFEELLEAGDDSERADHSVEEAR
jgi:hypothetical protein